MMILPPPVTDDKDYWFIDIRHTMNIGMNVLKLKEEAEL